MKILSWLLIGVVVAFLLKLLVSAVVTGLTSSLSFVIVWVLVLGLFSVSLSRIFNYG